MIDREIMEFDARQEQKVNACCGGKKTLVLLNERQETRPTADDGERDVWVYDGAWVDTCGESVTEAVRRCCLEEIDRYDVSDAVNGFYVDGRRVWLDKATRVGLMNSTAIAKAAGVKSVKLWFDGFEVDADCDKAVEILQKMELYALECYNVTAAHRRAVKEMDGVEDMLKYDFTEGYPEMVRV